MSAPRTASGDAGEETLSVSGERGGLWRDRGRAPHARVGDRLLRPGVRPRRRPTGGRAASFAAGLRLDLRRRSRGDRRRGARPRARPWRRRLRGRPAPIRAMARRRMRWCSPRPDRFTDAYQGAIETMNQIHPWTGGSHAASGVRAEIVYMPGPKGGAVFCGRVDHLELDAVGRRLRQRHRADHRQRARRVPVGRAAARDVIEAYRHVNRNRPSGG